MKKLVFTVLINTILISSDFDSGDGAPIRQGVHIEWYRTVAPGNDGEAIFVWSDTRYGMRNIFAHKVNGNGDLLWGEDGAVVTDLPGRQEDPVAITDGDGGVFVAWVDYRFDEQGDIFFQHLDNNGSIGLDAGGVALAQVAGKQISINMCTDSLGGVFVTWQDKRGGVHDDIYGTHISADYTVIAPGSGVPIVDATGDQNSKTIEYAGNNEAFIAWADFREGSNADVYAQRLDISMNYLFQANGLPVASTEQQELKPRATFVNATTSFIAWKEGDENSKVLYQFVDDNGLVFDNAKPISSNTSLQTAPRVKRSTAGEVFVNWKDLRNDPINGDQYFQKVDVNGDTQWGDGVRMDFVDDIDFSARFSAGVQGDLNIVWERGTFPNVDIYFQNIGAAGEYSLDDAVAISAEPNYQFAPILVGNALDGLFCIFGDKGTGSIDLKVQKVGTSFNPVWEGSGITAMEGLDGDIKYTDAYRISDEDIYFIWEDNRSSKKMYGSRITNLELSAINGRQLSFSDNSSSETDFSTPKTIRTATGIYVATFDGLTGEKYIRINRLDEQLQNVWDENGISFSTNGMANVFLAESASGIVCFWSEITAMGTYDIFFQSIGSDGNVVLADGGVALVESFADDYVMAVVPTPDDKYMIFWMEEAWPAASLKFTKIDQEGNAEIGWNPNGNSLSNSNYDSRNLQAKAVGSGNGVLATWVQEGNFSDIYAQLVDWSGEVQYATGGIPVVEEDNDQVELDFTFNELGTHAFLIWQDFRNGSDFEIYGDVLNLSNGSLESSGNIQFSVDTTNQYNPKAVSVQSNEFFVVWEDERGYYNVDPLLINGVDLYGSGYIIGSGMTTEPNGIPICIAYHKQQNINITKHQGEEYFLDWIDYRSSGKEDLANYYGRTLMKADLLSSTTACSGCALHLPQEFQLLSAYPNPFNGSLTFSFELPEKQAVNFAVYDLKGSKVYDRLYIPGVGGTYNVYWNAVNNLGQPVSAGIYIYEFYSNTTSKTGKVTYLK
tara:strand:- start:6117 stop:9134 length:3018 start_codon:yes stop_codon:yes gene_type:complete